MKALYRRVLFKELGREFHRCDTDTAKHRPPSVSREKRGQTKLVEPYRLFLL